MMAKTKKASGRRTLSTPLTSSSSSSLVADKVLQSHIFSTLESTLANVFTSPIATAEALKHIDGTGLPEKLRDRSKLIRATKLRLRREQKTDSQLRAMLKVGLRSALRNLENLILLILDASLPIKSVLPVLSRNECTIVFVEGLDDFLKERILFFPSSALGISKVNVNDNLFKLANFVKMRLKGSKEGDPTEDHLENNDYKDSQVVRV